MRYKVIKIIKLLKLAKSTVYHVMKTYNELGTSKDHPKGGRPRTALSKKMIKIDQKRLRRNPKRSAR